MWPVLIPLGAEIRRVEVDGNRPHAARPRERFVHPGPREPPMSAHFSITDQVLVSLQAAGVPAAVLTKLERLKWEKFASQAAFLKEITSRLSPQELAAYQNTLLQ